MTLPTFLGIGVMRGGTTWLHELLSSHPDIYVPKRRKEIRFFDQYYERGLAWYEGFFPHDGEANRYRAIGEITPGYLYCSCCAERIARISSIKTLILTLRNPIDRAYSHYGLAVRLGNTGVSFEDFMSVRPQAVQWGFYSRYLKSYLRYFECDQLKGLIYESAVADIAAAKETVAEYLGVPVEGFPAVAGTERWNQSYIPNARLAYAFTSSLIDYLTQQDMDWIINWVNRAGINRRRLFGKSRVIPPMSGETRRRLKQLYADEIDELETLLQIDLTCWRK